MRLCIRTYEINLDKRRLLKNAIQFIKLIKNIRNFIEQRDSLTKQNLRKKRIIWLCQKQKEPSLN